MQDIPTFSEGAVREAVLNAVSHRDYQNPGSVFIRQYADRIRIESPGGFPPGITPENIMDCQLPRNRRIAETLSKCGLIERSGQGVDRMFEEAIRQGKNVPNFSDSDSYSVKLTLDGKIHDINFLKFLEKVSSSKDQILSSSELIVLDLVHKDKAITTGHLKQILGRLKERGIVESAGRRGKYLLNRSYYEIAGKRGDHTRRQGLDKETNYQLLLKHISDNARTGSKLKELMQVLPSLSTGQVQGMLKQLKKQNKIKKEGITKAASWFPASSGNVEF